MQRRFVSKGDLNLKQKSHVLKQRRRGEKPLPRCVPMQGRAVPVGGNVEGSACAGAP